MENKSDSQLIHEMYSNVQHLKETAEALLKYIGSIRTGEFDLEAQKFYRQLNIDEALTKAAKAKGAKEMKRVYIPKEWKDGK